MGSNHLSMQAAAGERQYIRGSLEARFWPKVDRKGADECWQWLASRNVHGYGQIREGGAGSPLLMAHRAAYRIAYGDIPADHVVDHTCGHRGCVNPAHLEAVTQEENLRRSESMRAWLDRGQQPAA